jgi:hypothetical protein
MEYNEDEDTQRPTAEETPNAYINETRNMDYDPYEDE